MLTTLKLRVIFYSVGIFRTPSPENSILSNPERTALRRHEVEPGYLEVLQQREGSLNIKRLLLIEENHGQMFMTLYRRQGARPSPRKRNAKGQNGCLRRPYK